MIYGETLFSVPPHNAESVMSIPSIQSPNWNVLISSQAQQNGSVNGGGHHRHFKLTDDQAAKVGAAIQKQEPNLFKQLDQNGDGNLTSDELKAGIDKLRQQSSSDAQSAPASTQTNTSPLGVIRQAIKDVLSSSLGQSQGSSTGDVDNDGDSH